MGRPEGNLTDRIMRWLRDQPDVKAWKNHGNRYQVAGRPDIEGNCGPFAFYFEVKRPDGKGRKSKVQEAQMAKVHRAGCLPQAALFVESLDEVKRSIEFLRDVRRKMATWMLEPPPTQG